MTWTITQVTRKGLTPWGESFQVTPPGGFFLVLMGTQIMALARVFPARTRATPTDELAFVGPPDMFVRELDITRVNVSVTFTWQKNAAERLAKQWEAIAPVQVGGVAYGQVGDDFTPGKYVRDGYIFTSRGCPRKCFFCKVWHTHPTPILFPIVDGWNIMDDNLLACPRQHVENVFGMLRRQQRRIEFTGGLEARALEDYQVGLLADLRPRPNMFWAYDPGDAFETLQSAASRLLAAGFTANSHRLNCYVLIGYPRDTFSAAEQRLRSMLSLGFTPRAMLWRPDDKPSQERYDPGKDWKQFQRRWFRPAIIHAKNICSQPMLADPSDTDGARLLERSECRGPRTVTGAPVRP